MAQRVFGTRGRVLAAVVCVGLVGALAGVMAANAPKSSAATHTPSVSSRPDAHTTTGGS